MMQIRSQPRGVGFCPTDEDIEYYLKKKMLKQEIEIDIPEINIYEKEPWEIFCDKPCYFFSPTKLKYPKKVGNSLVDRTTKAGYWKATGSKSEVTGQVTKQIFVFHTGRPNKNDEKTGYILHLWWRNDKKDLNFCRLHYKQENGTLYQGESSNNMSSGTLPQGESSNNMSSSSEDRVTDEPCPQQVGNQEVSNQTMFHLRQQNVELSCGLPYAAGDGHINSDGYHLYGQNIEYPIAGEVYPWQVANQEISHQLHSCQRNMECPSSFPYAAEGGHSSFENYKESPTTEEVSTQQVANQEVSYQAVFHSWPQNMERHRAFPSAGENGHINLENYHFYGQNNAYSIAKEQVANQEISYQLHSSQKNMEYPTTFPCAAEGGHNSFENYKESPTTEEMYPQQVANQEVSYQAVFHSWPQNLEHHSAFPSAGENGHINHGNCHLYGQNNEYSIVKEVYPQPVANQEISHQLHSCHQNVECPTSFPYAEEGGHNSSENYKGSPTTQEVCPQQVANQEVSYQVVLHSWQQNMERHGAFPSAEDDGHINIRSYHLYGQNKEYSISKEACPQQEVNQEVSYETIPRSWQPNVERPGGLDFAAEECPIVFDTYYSFRHGQHNMSDYVSSVPNHSMGWL